MLWRLLFGVKSDTQQQSKTLPNGRPARPPV